MNSVKQKKTAKVIKNQLSVFLQPVQSGRRLHTFILSFGLTLALTILLVGWSITGYRCLMITNPPAGESIVCDIRSDYIRLRLGEWNFAMKIEFIPLR